MLGFNESKKEEISYNFVFSRNSLNNMKGVNKVLQSLAHRALELTLIDFGIPDSGGFRTAEDQMELYEKEPRVTWLDGTPGNESLHQSGLALDFFPVVDGKADYSEGACAHVAAAFLQAASEHGVHIEWSGFWRKFKEGCHIQLIP